MKVVPEHFGRLFLDGEFAAVYSQTTEEFKEIATLEEFIDLGESFNEGVEAYHLEISTSLHKDMTQYVWLDNLKKKAIIVFFDKDHRIHGLRLAPFISFPESDMQFTQNTYCMPIQAEWFVFWGGTNEFINYHYAYENQRYAYDLVMMRDGQTYRNSPDSLQHYYAFNQEVTAPADGRVVKVIDGFPDNPIGERNEDQPEGNCVIIEHENQEYSMLAHLKADSVSVAEGECIKQGDLVGLCGNSGNSTEPHIHFQVMDSPDYTTGRSIRIRFQDEGDPVQGDFVGN
ncbi:M23 family metallopeptidase [Metabacillus sp. SLBN-84]